MLLIASKLTRTKGLKPALSFFRRNCNIRKVGAVCTAVVHIRTRTFWTRPLKLCYGVDNFLWISKEDSKIILPYLQNRMCFINIGETVQSTIFSYNFRFGGGELWIP